MIGMTAAVLDGAALLVALTQGGLFAPKPELPAVEQIRRVPVEPAMLNPDCRLLSKHSENGQRFEATAPAKRITVDRDKSKVVRGASDLSLKMRSKYYSDLYYEAFAKAGAPPVFALRMKDSDPVGDNTYLVLGNDAYYLPRVYQRLGMNCRPGVIQYCSTVSAGRLGLNRSILEQMAASGSQRIRLLFDYAPGSGWCIYLSADEAGTLLKALDTA